MPKGYPTLSEEQKQEIIKRIKKKGEAWCRERKSCNLEITAHAVR